MNDKNVTLDAPTLKQSLDICERSPCFSLKETIILGWLLSETIQNNEKGLPVVLTLDRFAQLCGISNTIVEDKQRIFDAVLMNLHQKVIWLENRRTGDRDGIPYIERMQLNQDGNVARIVLKPELVEMVKQQQKL